MAIWQKTKNGYERNPRISPEESDKQLEDTNRYWLDFYYRLLAEGEIEAVEGIDGTLAFQVVNDYLASEQKDS
jgi:hypothetical protein